MQLFKALVGGLVGGAIGTAIYVYCIQQGTPGIPWIAVAVGLLAGIGVRLACGADRSLVTGLTATVMTLGTLFGWQYYASARSVARDSSNISQPIKIDNSRTLPNPQPDAGKSEPDNDGNEDNGNQMIADPPADTDKPVAGGQDDPGSNKNPEPLNIVNQPDTRSSNPGEGIRDMAPATSGRTNPVNPDNAATPLRRPSVNSRMANEAIAFGLAGLLAFVVGAGSSNQKSIRVNSK